MTGDLSIKGVTKLVTLDVEVLGTEADPWGGTRVGFEGTTSISRKDFGVDFNIPLDGGRLLIGDKIDIIVARRRPSCSRTRPRPPDITRPTTARSCERPPVLLEPGAVARRTAASVSCIRSRIIAMP